MESSIALKPVKIYLISPREPSGATWLINCLLELGVKTYRETLGDMWMPTRGGGYTLNLVENHLKKWLPILSARETFDFRDDIEVEWAHQWPTRRHARHRIIYFVRDPRDAIFSRYRRESPDMSFEEFLDFPDPHTLHDKIDTWSMFNELWLRQPDIRSFRFEDYKSDARKTLEAILDYAGLRVTEPELTLALENSTFEKAALAEKKYREDNPEDAQLINRASQVGGWKVSDDAACISRIARQTAGLLAHFGYESGHAAERISYLPQAAVLGFYRQLAVAPDFWQGARTGDDPSRLGEPAARLVRFMDALDDDRLRRSGLAPYEIHVLLRSVDEFAAGVGARRRPGLAWTQEHRLARLWWRCVDYMKRHNIQTPGWFRVWTWRLRGVFKNLMLGKQT